MPFFYQLLKIKYGYQLCFLLSGIFERLKSFVIN